MVLDGLWNSLDIGVGCRLGLLLGLLVGAWHPDIMGPFSGWEKPLAGYHLISLLDCNPRLFLLLRAWSTSTILYYPSMMFAPMPL
jgi:hypothetical protein